MTDKLTEFVNELDKNPELQERYKENPRQILESFGVAPNDIDLILGNDLSALKERLEMSGLKANVTISKSK